MPRSRSIAALLVVALALGGCTAAKRLFGDEDNTEKPSPLPAASGSLTVRTLWSRSIGRGIRDQYLKLTPAAADDRIFAASYGGEITALAAATGDRLWEVDTDLALSGGPGVGEGLVVVGTEEGVIVAYQASDGRFQWKARVSSEVLAAPQIAEGFVIVRTVDGKIFGLRAHDGSQAWLYDRSVPILSLRGTSAPVLYGGMAICGFDSGRVVALGIRDGRTLWERQVTIPGGSSELQRIVDIDSEPLVTERAIYAVTYQGRVVSLDPQSGELVWRRDMSSHAGMAADDRHLFVVDASSVLWALDRESSASAWSYDKLRARRLGTPVYHRGHVVVGDFEGYVHWIEADSGRLVGRARVDSEGVLVRPLVLGDTIYVFGNGGTLSALQAE